MTKGEFEKRLDANKEYVHLWTSLNNVKRSDVLEQIDDDSKLFKHWIDEAKKEFPLLATLEFFVDYFEAIIKNDAAAHIWGTPVYAQKAYLDALKQEIVARKKWLGDGV